MVRDEPLRRLDAEPLREHRAERLDLHLAEAGELADPGGEVLRVGRLGPEPLRLPAVALLDEGGELLHALRHVPGEAVDRRLLAKGRLERGGVGLRDPAGVERPDPLLQLQRPGERGRHGHLLVEREADQERHRLLREERVGLVVAGEVQPVGHAPILDTLAPRPRTTRGDFVEGAHHACCALVAAAALAGVALAKGPSGSSTGTGTVFFPNPVAQLQDETLTDQKDADYAALQPAYRNVTLTEPRRQRDADRRLGPGRQRDRRPGSLVAPTRSPTTATTTGSSR